MVCAEGPPNHRGWRVLVEFKLDMSCIHVRLSHQGALSHAQIVQIDMGLVGRFVQVKMRGCDATSQRWNELPWRYRRPFLSFFVNKDMVLYLDYFEQIKNNTNSAEKRSGGHHLETHSGSVSVKFSINCWVSLKYWLNHQFFWSAPLFHWTY